MLQCDDICAIHSHGPWCCYSTDQDACSCYGVAQVQNSRQLVNKAMPSTDFSLMPTPLTFVSLTMQVIYCAFLYSLRSIDGEQLTPFCTMSWCVLHPQTRCLRLQQSKMLHQHQYNFTTIQLLPSSAATTDSLHTGNLMYTDTDFCIS